VSLSLQLRWELAAEGVGVSVLCPGVLKTGIARAAGVGLSHLDLERVVADAPLPEGLARKTVRGVQKNRALIRYGVDAYLLSVLRLLPLWLIDPLGTWLAHKILRIVRGQEALPGS
jgi:short-subunit dehydrogenase